MSGMMRITIFLLLLSASLCHPVLAQDRNPRLPNPRLTPGEARPVTVADICKPEYKNPAKKVSIRLKSRVFTRYHIDPYKVGYNVEHLIPVRLGGTNSLDNLWPQPLSGEWYWHRKNQLEHR